MSLEIKVSLSNYARTRAALQTLTSRGLYRGAFRDTIKAVLDIAKRYAEGITHIWSGMLKRSHVVEYNVHRMRGSLHVDEHTLARDYGGRIRMPHQFVAEYAVYEHARGGTHAFYERTLRETAGILEFQGLRTLLLEIDRGVRFGRTYA